MSEVAAGAGSMLTCLVRVADIEWHHNALAGPVCEGHTEAVPHRLLPRLRVDAQAAAVGGAQVTKANPARVQGYMNSVFQSFSVGGCLDPAFTSYLCGFPAFTQAICNGGLYGPVCARSQRMTQA